MVSNHIPCRTTCTTANHIESYSPFVAGASALFKAMLGLSTPRLPTVSSISTTSVVEPVLIIFVFIIFPPIKFVSFFTSVGHPFPAICIRTSTERPEAIDKGDFIIAGIDEKSLLQAVETDVELCRDGQHGIPVPDYVDENVSTKVVKIVQSYVGIINKMVWRKF